MQPDNQTWDPGKIHTEEEKRNKLFEINVSEDIYSMISMSMVSAVDGSAENGMEEDSRTELDSHANMPVLGSNDYVISHTGRIVHVNQFTLDYYPINILLVTSALRSN